ncbi:MAG: glycogen synthase GlgA [Candidatus Eremiobacteraeota bacterium]|nr:glycogen synthase GlgA [Candidatus Eremiobacteraeota bacterium]MBV8367179.1 glycogen synthase GlgA [Candidatus Eremiobacteraeota bacterium]
MKLRVLFVIAEASPLAKAGGLGDVGGALPSALRSLGVDVRLMLPGYPSALNAVQQAAIAHRFDDSSWAGPLEIIAGHMPGGDVPVYLVKSKRYFERPGGPYTDESGKAWPDETERFAALCHAAVRFVDESRDWRPSIVHANDWHAALIPAMLKAQGLRSASSLLTIHNASYQGVVSKAELRRYGIPVSQLRGRRAHSFLELGARHADRLSTVSPRYAKEIQTKKFGCGLERLFASRARTLVGILNGADYTRWDPAIDVAIQEKYDSTDLSGKAACKSALQRALALEGSSQAPLIGIVSRLTWQKGLDLVPRIAKSLIACGARIAVLGQGEPRLEADFLKLAARYPYRVAVHIGFDEALAHQITAGADIFLMPSRFEPCGIAQLHSLRYGTVPVVARVGGLADTVEDGGERGIASGKTTGFLMRRFSSASLGAAVKKTIAVFAAASEWQTLQRNGMKKNFSWDRSARAYRDLYMKTRRER